MNRRLTGIILAAAVLALAGTGWWLLRAPGQKEDLSWSRYLPADTGLVLSLHDLAGLSDRFPATPLGRFLAPESMVPILRDLGVAGDRVRAYERGYRQTLAVLRHPGFRMVFGDDAVVALLPVEAAGDQPLAALRQGLLVEATTASTQALTRLARVVLKGQVESVEQDGVAMTRIQVDSRTRVFAWSEDDRLLLALDPRVIVAAVRRAGAGQGSLVDDPEFRAVAGFWHHQHQDRVYVRGMLRPDRLPRIPAAESLRFLDQWQRLVWVGGERDRGWRLDGEAVAGAGRHQVVRADNQTLFLLDSHPLLYGWTASLAGLLGAVDRGSPARPPSWLAGLGVKPAEILAGFGPQAGVALTRLGQNGFLPLPLLAAALPVRDRAAAAGVVKKIRGAIGPRGYPRQSVRRDSETGAEIFSWLFLPGEATVPSLALGEKLALIASNPRLAARLLARAGRAPGLDSRLAESLGKPLAAEIKGADAGLTLFWPSRFARQAGPALAQGLAMFRPANGVSLHSLARELMTLMRAGELVVSASSASGQGMRFLLFCRGNQGEDAGKRQERKRDG